MRPNENNSHRRQVPRHSPWTSGDTIWKTGGRIAFDNTRRASRLYSEPPDAPPPSNPSADLPSYSETAYEIQRQEEEKARGGDRGTGLTSEEKEKFDSRKGDMEEMRRRIRERAEEMGVEKSATTAEVISKAAENAARNRGSSSELNLSVFTKKEEDVAEDLPKYLRTLKDKDSGRELSDAEKLAADPFAEMNILQAMFEEVKLVEWPGPGQVFRQTVVTSLALGSTVVFIVTLDSTLKTLYQSIGLYPK